MEELAVITEVGIGNRDTGKPCLWFTVTTKDGYSALQVLDWSRAKELIQESGVREVKNLNNRACLVEVDDGLIKYKSFFM